jgi:hypothetical protein
MKRMEEMSRRLNTFITINLPLFYRREDNDEAVSREATRGDMYVRLTRPSRGHLCAALAMYALQNDDGGASIWKQRIQLIENRSRAEGLGLNFENAFKILGSFGISLLICFTYLSRSASIRCSFVSYKVAQLNGEGANRNAEAIFIFIIILYYHFFLATRFLSGHRSLFGPNSSIDVCNEFVSFSFISFLSFIPSLTWRGVHNICLDYFSLRVSYIQ